MEKIGYYLVSGVALFCIDFIGRNIIFHLGKRANEIGPLGVFRQQVNDADEKLLSEGNFTDCPSIETLKKAAYDYRKLMHIDEDIFKECRILKYFYFKEDISSTVIQGTGSNF